MWLALAIVLPIIAVEYCIHAVKNVKKWEHEHKLQPDFLPFRRRDLDLWSRPKLYVGAILFLGIRILVVLLSVVLEWLSLKFIFHGVDLSKQPLPVEKTNACRKVTRVFTRLLLFGLGYWYIEERSKPSRSAPVIVSNHVSFVDILYLMHSDASPSFVSKKLVQSWPCIGLIATSLQCVFIERAGDREVALKAVSDRQLDIASGQPFPQLAIFAEGTTTNGSILLQFRKGGFVNRLPVQPVFLHYPFSHVSAAMDCVPLWTVVLLMCSQFYNRLQVTWLPVCETDALTPVEFANKVQSQVASVKNLPTSTATLADKYTFLEILRGSKQKI
mmetsp:Transcript_26684/g.48065  ORF Transcript_26684/g.48065 Transcript_26684/m.48065 type:complete len:330 (+) Transcript_26684:16-1005(+)